MKKGFGRDYVAGVYDGSKRNKACMVLRGFVEVGVLDKGLHQGAICSVLERPLTVTPPRFLSRTLLPFFFYWGGVCLLKQNFFRKKKGTLLIKRLLRNLGALAVWIKGAAQGLFIGLVCSLWAKMPCSSVFSNPYNYRSPYKQCWSCLTHSAKIV